MTRSCGIKVWNFLEQNGAPEIILLHCNTEYPTPFSDVNLLAMKQLENMFQKTVGYSDHSTGIEIVRPVHNLFVLLFLRPDATA